MKSQPGKETIANNKRNILLKNKTHNVVGKLVPKPFSKSRN